MYCNKCGKEINNYVKFCPNCGHELNTNNTKDSVGASAKRTNAIIIFLIVAVLVVGTVTLALYFNKSSQKQGGGNANLDYNTIAVSQEYDEETQLENTNYDNGENTLWDDSILVNTYAADGHTVSDGKYYYLTYQGEIYRIKKNSMEVDMLENVSQGAGKLNIIGNKLYYVSNNGICEYNISSKREKIISNAYEDIDFMRIYKGYIYFTVYIDDFIDSIYRMKIDGSEDICLKAYCIDSSGTLTIYDDYIYFVDEEERTLKKMSLDGAEIITLMDDEISKLSGVNIENGYIYYCKPVGKFRLGSNDCRIFRANLDGTGKMQITSVTTNDFIVYNGKIYYEGYKDWDTDSKVSLCCIDVDGANDTILELKKYNSYGFFSAVDNYVIYFSSLNVEVGSTINFVNSYDCLDTNTNTISTLDVIS